MIGKKKKEQDFKLMIFLNFIMISFLVLYFIASTYNAMDAYHNWINTSIVNTNFTNTDIIDNIMKSYLIEIVTISIYFIFVSTINYILYRKNKNKHLVIFLVGEFILSLFTIVYFIDYPIINNGVVDLIRTSMAMIMPLVVFIYGSILYLKMPEKKLFFK